MNLIMVTPRVGVSDPLLAFIPTWVTHLARRVDRLWVVTPRAEAVPLPDNVTVYQVGRDYNEGETIFHALRNFHRVMWCLTHDEQVDGIFTHMYPKFALLSAPYARSKRIPLVMWYSHAHVSLQLRLAVKLATKVVTASQGSFTMDNGKKLVISHGIDTEIFSPGVADAQSGSRGIFKIVTVGRISPVKDCATLIKAAHALKKRGLDGFRVTFVGSAPPQHQQYEQQLRTLVHDLLLEGHVHFAGAVSNAQTLAYYQANAVFVNMQAEGGVGKAVLEAMATGIPTLLCTTAFNEHLGNLVQELIFKTGNPVDLADKLLAMAKRNPQERMEIGECLRHIVVDHYNLGALAVRIVNLFNDLQPAKQ